MFDSLSFLYYNKRNNKKRDDNMDIPFLGEAIDFAAKNCHKGVESPKKVLENGMPKINLKENEELKDFANGLIDVHHMEFPGSCGHWSMFKNYVESFMEDCSHDDFDTAFAEKYLNDTEFLIEGFGWEFEYKEMDKVKEIKAVEILNKSLDKEKEILRWYFEKRDY
jgi:hypothetical protein